MITTNLAYRSLIVFCFLFFLSQTDIKAQNEVIDGTALALQSGSSKELIKYCDRNVELIIDGEIKSNSREQAEFVLKDFFKRYDAISFSYLHQGSSPSGAKYAIGTYRHPSGSYRIYIKMNNAGNAYVIDTMDFSKE